MSNVVCIRTRQIIKGSVLTPEYDTISSKFNKLQSKSKYNSEYNVTIYRDLEFRLKSNGYKHSITYGKDNIIVNNDGKLLLNSYGRGCVHSCANCTAKDELWAHGYWNTPFPMPIDITNVWEIFYTVFETTLNSEYRKALEAKTPIQLGFGSDSFMFLDMKYGITKEILTILNYYNYPYTINTKSDLISYDNYIDVLNKDLATITIDIPSVNDKINKLLEAGAPSSLRRLKAFKKLNDSGFNVAVKCDLYPMGHDISTYEMFNEIAFYDVGKIVLDFKSFSSNGINSVKRSSGINLRTSFSDSCRKAKRSYDLDNECKLKIINKVKNICKELNIVVDVKANLG